MLKKTKKISFIEYKVVKKEQLYINQKQKILSKENPKTEYSIIRSLEKNPDKKGKPQRGKKQ